MTISMAASRYGVQVVRFPHLAVAHGVAARAGGVSRGRYGSLNLGPRSGDELDAVRENRRRFLSALTLPQTTLVPRQVHGAHVSVHRHGEPLPSGGVVEGDGVIADAPGLTLAVLAADCAPILLHDPVRGVAGAVHAGWRGVAAGIAVVAIRRMEEAFGCAPADIRAGIGPAIGRCCYEVGAEVVEAVGAATPGGAKPLTEWQADGKARIDIVAATVAQLGGAGLRAENVLAAGICTACRTDLFYSHRREGEPTGRNGAAIALTD